MAVPLKLDITTGDKITPKEIEFSYKSMFEDREIPVLAYNLSTILAEKLETVVTRGELNTRPRDYYDIFILDKLYESAIDWDSVKQAFSATVEKRGSEALVSNYVKIIEGVVMSSVMQSQWEGYVNNFAYAQGISFKDTCDTVQRLLESVVKE